ncbi:kinetochore protein Spc24 [Clupea harengus]|uniref:Kinetochore protein Spc24 n=1 Tax=Clupea harengus TaxID=7950 RepID=A0A6P8FGR8_CLUHA|nr:kinetochore protein Spc24 [Clupea harengus]XP_031427570.1 kinetochore protein Spc24 [Clupea harengus]XP_031427575.1 kinetochore protein Spc24 [Clupea harengus]XP_031427583.1 kinetochore protein Spc24 [Clupea harengus]
MGSQDELHDLEESLNSLVQLINSSHVEEGMQGIRGKVQQLYDHHIDTEKTTTQLLNDLIQSEERVGQTLLDLESHRNKRTEELEMLQHEIQKKQTQSMNLESEMQFLQRELERLRESEQEMQAMQQEVDEDTTEVIPSAIYLAQLYYKVTKIKLEMDGDPKILKGVHYGKDLVTPINIDTSQLSPCAVSDQLWNLVSTEWN